MSSSAQDKNLPATAKSLRKAREEGNIARSRELGNLAVLGGGAVLLMVFLPTGFTLLLEGLRQQLHFDHRALAQPDLLTGRLGEGLVQWLWLVLPLAAAVSALAVFVNFAAGAWTLTTKTITPDISHVSPLKGLGRLFSKQQLFETFKLAFLTAVMGVIGWHFLSGHFLAFGSLLMQPLEGGLGQLGQWMMAGVGMLLLAVAVFAGIDFPMQKFLYAERMKMSREEIKQEHKQDEGDPQMKGRRRQRQREIAMRLSVGRVPKADLVVMNPTHYAVALQYDDSSMAAPRVIAKGADLIALKIRDVAKAHNVPVLQSPVLARALFAHTEIDGEIPSALYTAVAQVLAYVYQLKAAMGGRGAMPVQPVPDVPPELDPHHRKTPTPEAEA